jgi:hypothetical protein
MGFIKDSKAESIEADAAKAYAEGRWIFAARLNTPTFSFSQSGPVPGWAEMIEGVERSGWALSEFTVAHDDKSRPAAYTVFRRRP